MLDSMGGRNGQSSKVALAAATLLALGLAGCPAPRRAAPPSVPPPVPGEVPERIAPASPGATRYRVSGNESLVVVLVNRGGALAALGHNHVIASHTLGGVIDLREPATATTFELHLPVAGLTVDEPGLRSGRGPDYASEVADSAREGTRDNMLGEGVLDAARHPEIVVRAVSLAGGPRNFSARLAVNVRGVRHELAVPVQVDRPDADRLHVTARFPVAQSDLGLVPFSAMLGALRVEDLLGVEVEINARRVP
jgi:hypothetical protein